MKRFFKKTPVFLGVLVFVVLGASGFFAYRTVRTPVIVSKPTPTTVIPAVAIHDTYAKGKHTLTGSVPVTNVCETIDTRVIAPSANTIRIDITTHTDSNICLELPSAKTFSVTVTASSTAAVTVFVNSARANVTSL